MTAEYDFADVFILTLEAFSWILETDLHYQFV